MLYFKRTYAKIPKAPKFKMDPGYKLKCGLEIHTQLSTNNKLFSLTANDAMQSPNTNTSFFDVSLPGTQPKLNPEVVLFTTKLAVALGSVVNCNSKFDRKHYFYGDQPLGYQITQHYEPFAQKGSLLLTTNDGVSQNKTIGITQLQIEQDTGKSSYENGLTHVDLNRSNVPLIEMVTDPDFTTLDEVRTFIKKYQNLVRFLRISTGDLETGAMRVDVNVSVNGHNRVELKNLPNTSSIIHAIQYEYQRQMDIIRSGGKVDQETRGWNGTETVFQRNKETSVDYRYMPDPELPPVSIMPELVESVRANLTELPDDILNKLLSEPYCLKLKDAKILTTNNEELLQFFFDVFNGTQLRNRSLVVNWTLHELLGALTKLEREFTADAFPVAKFSHFLSLIDNNKISQTSAKLLLLHVLSNEDMNTVDLEQIIEEYELGVVAVQEDEIVALCQQIIEEHPDIVSTIAKKPKSIKFLVGQAMRLSQGRIDAREIESTFRKLLL